MPSARCAPALKLVEKVAGLDTVAAAPLQVRVGIATGLVVVGDLIGEGAAQEQAVVGETPNLAARLQALAEPGTVVIAPSTRRLTGGLFDYEDLGRGRDQGLGRAGHRPARVVRGSAAESRFEALRTADLTPLVGRDEELALLQRRWQQAKAGEGCVVLVSGEPGIGKSRLAQTLLERLSGEPHTRLRSFCSPHHQDSALYPTITQLERAAGFRREDTAEQRLDKLEAVLAQATNDLGEAAPLLAALLSLPTGERYPPLNLTPQKQKEKTLRALVAQVEGLAARQPVLMLFEDAQWSDPTSLELLGPDHRPGARASGPADRHLPAGVHPALDRPAARHLARSQPPGAAAAGRDDRGRHRRQGPARGDRRADHRPHRRRAAVRRGADQGGGRERHADRHRRPLHRGGAGDAVGDPGELAGLAVGPARSAGAGARGGADRGRLGPAVLARADRRRGADAAAATGRRPGAAGRAPS